MRFQKLTVVAMVVFALLGCGNDSPYDLRACNRSARLFVLIKEAYDAGEPSSVAKEKATELQSGFSGYKLGPEEQRAMDIFVDIIYKEKADIKYLVTHDGRCKNYNPQKLTSAALAEEAEVIAATIRELQAASKAKEEAKPAQRAPMRAPEKLCAHFDLTGLLSSPCDISYFIKTVEVRLDMSSSDARKFCPSVRNLTSARFDSGWSLRIFSPYSGDNPIATCSLN